MPRYSLPERSGCFLLPYIDPLLRDHGQNDPLLNASCCPAILVGIAGPHLAVSGIVFGDKITAQRLTDYIYLGSRPNHEGMYVLDEGIRLAARVLRAIDTSVKMIKAHYLELDYKATIRAGPRGIVRPHFEDFTVGETGYKLKYVDRMAAGCHDKAVFEALMEPASPTKASDVELRVAVKFTHSYCKAAHHLLANRSLAPPLYYCEKVESTGMHVVVMGLAKGISTERPNKHPTFIENLREAVQILHDADFVHGDLREPNVLVTEDGHIDIIDFDWCGKDGEVRYPCSINLGEGLGWCESVTPGGLIKKEHDLALFSHLTGSTWSGEANE